MVTINPCDFSTPVPCAVQNGFIYTRYPCDLDNDINPLDTKGLPKAIDNSTPVKAEIVNRQREAILAIEGELGINPSGTSGTVKDRLDEMQTVLCALWEIDGYISAIGLSDVMAVSNSADGRVITNLANPVLGQDAATKNYVDGYVAELKSQIGGEGALPHIGNEQVIIGTADGYAVRQLTEDDILPGFAISSFNPAGTNYAAVVEVGTTISVLTATASYVNGPPSAGSIADTGTATISGSWSISTPFAAATRTGTVTSSTNGQAWTATLSATGPAGAKTLAHTTTWLPKVYHGAAAPGTYNAAFIAALTSSNLQPDASVTYTDNAGPGHTFYFALPSSYAAPIFTVGGIVYAGSGVATAVSVTSNNVTQNYNIWQVVTTLNLGSQTIVVTHV
jgi:hypothetical protein